MGKFLAGLGGGLSLFVRHLAWLSATPKPDPASRRGKAAADHPQISRMERLKRSGVTPPMPPNPSPQLFDRLLKIGLCEGNGMALVPITWREIDAFCGRMHIDPPSWQIDLIHRLSVDYVAESRRAEDEHCPPPWRAPITQREIDTEEARLTALLG